MTSKMSASATRCGLYTAGIGKGSNASHESVATPASEYSATGCTGLAGAGPTSGRPVSARGSLAAVRLGQGRSLLPESPDDLLGVRGLLLPTRVDAGHHRELAPRLEANRPTAVGHVRKPTRSAGATETLAEPLAEPADSPC